MIGSLVVTIALTRAATPHTLILTIPGSCEYPSDICRILLQGSSDCDGVYVELYRKALEYASQDMGYLFQLADCAEDIVGTPVEDINLSAILKQLPFAPRPELESDDLVDVNISSDSKSTMSESKSSTTRPNAFWTTRLTQFPAYTTNKNLLSFRNNLPAASQKNEFLCQIEQHLVRLIYIVFFEIFRLLL